MRLTKAFALLGLTLCLLLPSLAQAGSSINPVPLGAGAFGTFGGSTTTSPNINTTGYNFIRIAITSFVSQTGLGAPTDNKGNTYTQLGSQVGQSAAYITYWYCANPTVGSGHNFTYNPGTPIYAAMDVLAYSGVATVSPVEATVASNTTASSGAIATGSLTPANNGDLLELVGTTAGAGGTPFSATGGFTLRDQLDGAAGSNVSMVSFNLLQTTATAANPSMSYTSSGPPATVLLVAIKPASYTPPAANSKNLLMHAIP